MSKYLTFSLLIIAFVLGVGAGFTLTPEYAEMRTEKASPMMKLGSTDRNLDLRYVDGMIAHHQAAIYLLEQALDKTQRHEVQQLAHAVIAADTEGIKKLYQYKKDWYGNTKKINNFTKVQLGENDGKFDLRLINALLDHHQEAIEVAKEVRTKSTRTEVLNTADEVITNLTASANQLRQWRKEWYGIE